MENSARELDRTSKLISFLAIALISVSIGNVLLGASIPVALTGVVSSDAEGPMEGVVVSAKRTGGTISVAVITDKQGRYSFPATRLAPGKYHMSIRAVGYVPSNPDIAATVGKEKTEFDIKLTTTSDIASQLSDLEWLASIPGTDEQKQKIFVSCNSCHALAPIFKSTHDSAGWEETLVRMHNYVLGSLPTAPILSPIRVGLHQGDKEFARYLSTINLSSKSTHDFELKPLPRPHGDDTKVIITEYDLPRANTEPHDAVSDKEGMIWYGDYHDSIIGRLNPRTGEVQECRDPLVKPGFAGMFLDLEFDPQGNPWLGRSGPGFNGFAEFDKKSQTFKNYTDPIKYDESQTQEERGGINFVLSLPTTSFLAISPDGKVWSRDNFTNQAFRLDPATGKMTTFDEFPPELMSKDYHGPEHRVYGIKTDSEGNLYEADISSGYIVKVDGVTGKVTMYPTPTRGSGPRRMHMDPQGRLWFGEHYAKQIGMLDTKTGKIQEWPMSIPWFAPYDVAPDKNGNVWTASMTSDIVVRFTPKTGQFRYYQLPSLDVNPRRVDVDNSGPQPVFWLGENHRGKIVKVEPIE